VKLNLKRAVKAVTYRFAITCVICVYYGNCLCRCNLAIHLCLHLILSPLSAIWLCKLGFAIIFISA